MRAPARYAEENFRDTSHTRAECFYIFEIAIYLYVTSGRWAVFRFYLARVSTAHVSTRSYINRNAIDGSHTPSRSKSRARAWDERERQKGYKITDEFGADRASARRKREKQGKSKTNDSARLMRVRYSPLSRRARPIAGSRFGAFIMPLRREQRVLTMLIGAHGGCSGIQVITRKQSLIGLVVLGAS